MALSESFAEIGAAWWEGCKDAIRIHRSLLFFLTSKTIRARGFQCFVLNGLVFLGSIFVMEHVLSPLFSFLLFDAESNVWAHQVDSAFVGLYQLLWVYPIYMLSFLLNAMWYQDIADVAFVIHGSKVRKDGYSIKRYLAVVTEEIYHALLLLFFMLQVGLLSMIPWVGPLLTAICVCWLYALYSFEYKWQHQQWPLETRLAFFEERWPYFLGFGFPLTLLTIVWPKFVGAGVYAFVFPFCIILAICAKPVKHKAQKSPLRLPIFRLAKLMNNVALKLLGRVAKPKSK